MEIFGNPFGTYTSKSSQECWVIWHLHVDVDIFLATLSLLMIEFAHATLFFVHVIFLKVVDVLDVQVMSFRVMEPRDARGKRDYARCKAQATLHSKSLGCNHKMFGFDTPP